MSIRRLTTAAGLFLSSCVIAVPLMAQDAGQQGAPGAPGPKGAPGPAGPAGTTILGLDQSTALIAGALILAVIVILAIVSMANKGKTA